MLAAARRVHDRYGRIDALVNSAGITAVMEFEHVTAEQFERVMRTNVLGTRNAVAACLPYLKRCPNADGAGARIVLVSSMAGQSGIFGYTAYSPSKFALNGFAQCLQMELRRHNVWVSVVYPPDTDTPMYKEENKTKPKETLELSAGTGVFSAEQVSTALVDGMVRGAFGVSVGFDGWMLRALMSGMGPEPLWDAFVHALVAFPLRVVSIGYTFYFYAVVDRHWRAKKDKAA